MQSNLNRNHTLHFLGTYRSLPIINNRCPMVAEYLETLYRVIQQAQADYSRVCAFRFDLRFPRNMNADTDNISNEAITRFIESIKAKIRHNRECAKQQNAYAHNTKVRYVWARETGDDKRVHYHAVILVNHDVFFTLGRFGSEAPNMANRIREAWASALSLPLDSTTGLVHFPDNAVYRIDRNHPQDLAAFFHRASYLCKAETKHFGNGQHGFGSSRH